VDRLNGPGTVVTLTSDDGTCTYVAVRHVVAFRPM
jgi:hypothetical protein